MAGKSLLWIMCITTALFVLCLTSEGNGNSEILQLGELRCEYVGRDVAAYRWLNDDLLRVDRQRIYDCRQRKIVAELDIGPWDPVRDVWINPRSKREEVLLNNIQVAFLVEEEKRLVTLHGNGLIGYWRTSDWSLERRLETELFRKTDIVGRRVTPDRKYFLVSILVGTEPRTVLLDWRTGKVVPHRGPVRIHEFSRSGKYAFSIERRGLVVWEYPSWQLVKTLPNFLAQYDIIFDEEGFPKGPIIHTGADDRHLLIWFFSEEDSKRRVVLYDWLTEQELASRKPTHLEICPILFENFQYLADTPLGLCYGYRLPETEAHYSKRGKTDFERVWAIWDVERLIPILEFPKLPAPNDIATMLISPNARRIYIRVENYSRPNNPVNWNYVGDIPAHWLQLLERDQRERH